MYAQSKRQFWTEGQYKMCVYMRMFVDGLIKDIV